MPSSLVATRQVELFPYSKWDRDLLTLARQYKAGSPFPHIFLAEFLGAQLARALAKEFPDSQSKAWTQYKHFNENKVGLAKKESFPPLLAEIADELNSPAFVNWLSALTGIPGLMADPCLEGGGLHQSGRGGFLNVHADFIWHHYHKNWRRRVNLILYLNEGWRPEWGGDLELWDRKMQRCVTKLPPLLDHALIFNTDETSHHGFPEPLGCPENVSRKSLAFYYYTEEDNPKDNPKSVARSTNYHARPEDGLGRALMIWLDKKALSIYSRAKARLGFSDDLASRILGKISRKK
jgi:hypothetical protein